MEHQSLESSIFKIGRHVQVQGEIRKSKSERTENGEIGSPRTSVLSVGQQAMSKQGNIWGTPPKAGLVHVLEEVIAVLPLGPDRGFDFSPESPSPSLKLERLTRRLEDAA